MSRSRYYDEPERVFIVMSADDWEQEQETLHVLQSKNLMQQIADSLETHIRGKGYKPIY